MGELMLDISDKKTCILCILKLLEQCTDTERHLKNEAIDKLLLQDYNVKLTRNAISRHMGLLLDEFHYDIVHDNSGRNGHTRTKNKKADSCHHFTMICAAGQYYRVCNVALKMNCERRQDLCAPVR